MNNRIVMTQLTLWCFVLSAGLLTGGSIFEGVVLTPLWSQSLPESVRQWPHGTIQSRFFAIATPFYALATLGLLVTSRWMPAKQRKWALVAGVCGLIVVIATFTFFFPILQRTEGAQGAGLGDEEIVRQVQLFKTWHWGRWALLIVGWMAGLRAFRCERG